MRFQFRLFTEGGLMGKQVRTPVNFSEFGGYRYLHFGSEWIQGAMRLNRPYELALEYQKKMAAIMLFDPHPQNILQLGLGAAGLAKYTWKFFPQAKTRVIEISEDVYMASRMWFKMPDDDEHLEVIFKDCQAFLKGKACTKVDWLFVDIYDAQAWGPVYDDVPFYRLCRHALKEGGISSYNLFGGEDFDKSKQAIDEAFDGHTLSFPATEDGNKILLAKNGPQDSYSIELLEQRAAQLQSQYRIPAKRLLKELCKENGFKNKEEILF